jgi:hypothetical protein
MVRHDEYQDEYCFWAQPPDNNNFENTHHEQTHTQHFPDFTANVSILDPFPSAPHVTYGRGGGYEPMMTKLLDHTLLAALKAQMAQISLLMNHLPHKVLRTSSTMRPFQFLLRIFQSNSRDHHLQKHPSSCQSGQPHPPHPQPGTGAVPVSEPSAIGPLSVHTHNYSGSRRQNPPS